MQYAIPQVPKRAQKPSHSAATGGGGATCTSSLAAIDVRPRLNTPLVVPDPSDVLSGKQGGGAAPTESHGTFSNYHPMTTTTTMQSSSGVNGIAGSDDDKLVSHNDEPELYTEAYAHMESEENDAEYAVVSPTRMAVVPAPRLSSSKAPATGKSSPSPSPPSRPSRPPPPVDRGRSSPIPPPIAHLRRSPSPAPPLPPPPTQSVPTPPIPTSSASSQVQDPSSTVESNIDDHEYNSTSHVQDRIKKRSRGTPPIPPPTAPPTESVDDHEYNTTSHVKKRRRGPPPIPPPTESVDDHEYNSTSHVKDVVRKRSRGTPPIPPSTAPPTIRSRSTKSPSPPSIQQSAGDEYSVLDRPDKKPRAISPAPAMQPSSESEEYSVLTSELDKKKNPSQVSELEEYSVLGSEPQAVPSAIPDATEGYGRLDLDAVSAAASNSENVGGDSSLYEEVRSEPPIHDNKTGSNGIGPASPPLPIQPQMDRHPRALARKASDKFKDRDTEATVISSRDRSKLPAYQQPNMEEATGDGGGEGTRERSGARLPPRGRPPPPVPHPKRQKKMPPQQISDEAAANAHTGTSTSELASDGGNNSSTEVPLNVLERAGYETRNTFSPPPEEMDVERREQKSPPQIKPPTPTRRVSPVPAKARGPKPPPMPKPKQISPPTPQRAAAKVANSSGQGLTKGEGSTTCASTEGGQGMDHEPIRTSGNPSSMEAVDGSHDSHVTGVHVSSPKIELDIDHITRVGSAMVDYDLENMAESLYDNQMIMNAVSLSDGASPEQQKRASRTSYENQVVVDAVQQQDGTADGGAMEDQQGDGSQVSSLEQNLHQSSHGAEVEVCEYGEGDQIMESANGDDACTKLTPSDVFTVPQHAVPGHLGYCDVDTIRAVKNVSSEHQIPAVALTLGEREGEGEGDDSGTFVVQPHSYPDSRGYCDIEIQDKPVPPHSTAVTQPDSVATSTAAMTIGGNREREDGEGGEWGAEGADDSGTFVVQPHAYPDSQGYCDIDLKQPPALQVSHSSTAAQPNSVDSTAAVATDDVRDGEGGEGEGGGVGDDDSGTFVVQPHAHPDSQGYWDIEIKQPHGTAATQSGSDANTAVATATTANVGASKVVTDAQGYCDIDIQPLSTSDKSQVKDSEIVTDARGYCDIDILPSPPPASSGANSAAPSQAEDKDSLTDASTKDRLSGISGTADDVVMDAQGYCDIDIKSPPPKSVSHEYEIVPESDKQSSAAAKGGSRSVPPPAGKAPPIPSSRPTKPAGGSKPVQDKAQEESGIKASSNSKGVPPKRPPPRRRAPPPPPLKSKTVDEPSENSPQSSSLNNELVISTGLATLPRSPKRQPPKPPAPFASSSSPLLSKKMSPLLGKKLELKSPLPSSSPLSSPHPPGSPKGFDSTSETPQSSGFKKKFKGLFNKQKQMGGEATNATSNSNSPGGLVRKPSWGRKKKGKTTSNSPSSQDNGGGAQLSPSTKARSLPGYAQHRSQPHAQQGGTGGVAGTPPPDLQLQCSYDADQEDDGDEFGIYSTIQEDKLKPSSTEKGEAVGGAVAAAVMMASPDGLKDDGVRYKFNVYRVYANRTQAKIIVTIFNFHPIFW